MSASPVRSLPVIEVQRTSHLGYLQTARSVLAEASLDVSLSWLPMVLWEVEVPDRFPWIFLALKVLLKLWLIVSSLEVLPRIRNFF